MAVGRHYREGAGKEKLRAGTGRGRKKLAGVGKEKARALDPPRRTKRVSK